MKTFLKKFFIVIAILLSSTIVTNLAAKQQAHAAYSCRQFLGLTSWDCNVPDNWQGDDAIINNIVAIIANISNNLLVITAYLILGFVIYGGYLYISASGDPNKTSSGKKTLTRAFIGLAIVLSAKVIVSSLHIILLGDSGQAAFSEDCTEANSCVTDTNALWLNLIQWVIGIAGIIAAIFVVLGAIGYLTSAGDPNKLKKAKDTIMYALIGLAIVGLAELITSVVSNMINSAVENSYINTTSIAKELK